MPRRWQFGWQRSAHLVGGNQHGYLRSSPRPERPVGVGEPAQINYMHVVGEKTVLYFDKERSIELGEPIETLLALFDPSWS